MALLAGHAFVDVRRVIEVDEIGQVVHLHPRDWRSLFKTDSNRFQQRAFGLDSGVAIQTGLRRRNRRERSSFNGRVTIPTIHL